MYYDARPTTWSGFDMETDAPLKSYYGIKAFGEVRELKNAVPVQTEGENVYSIASTNGEECAILLTHFGDDKTAPKKDVKIEFKGVDVGEKVKVSYYLIDESCDCTLVREEIFTAKEFACYLKMDLYSSYLIKIKAA